MTAMMANHHCAARATAAARVTQHQIRTVGVMTAAPENARITHHKIWPWLYRVHSSSWCKGDAGSGREGGSYHLYPEASASNFEAA